MSLNTKDLKYVREALLDVSNRWYDIGIELDLELIALDNIRDQYTSNDECLREMLKVWLRGLRCSWRSLVDALECKALKKYTGAVATEIEEKYCRQTEPPSASKTQGMRQFESL